MRKLVLAATIAAVLVEPAAAASNDRYVARPPVMLSPDLNSPWLLQFPAGSRAPRVQTASASPSLFQKLFGGQAAKPQPQQAQTGRATDPAFLPTTVSYDGPHKPGTIVIDTDARYLYLVESGGTARRYGVGVGRPGFEWAGTRTITRKAEWPTWTPPPEMRARERKRGRILPVSMKGGPQNPLGARAMYLGSSLYRIHGTSEPWTIGRAVSSGCIRMRNEDVSDLYERVKVGTKVIVL
ncbi:MAG: L,D-transpeptidase [Rhizobiales bacterium]|nr:L,D-transpeptidase [Hyphomicrobiales bacterium]